METDYSLLNENDFKDVLKKYVAFNVLYGKESEYSPFNTTDQHIPSWVDTVKVESPSKKFVLNKKLNLNIEKWREFFYKDIFEIKKGNTPKIQSENNDKNEVRLITATGLNNGVSKTITSPSTPNNQGLITVSSNGAVGDDFYQNKGFFATGDVNILTSKFKMNKYIAMFVITVIRQEKFRFNYGRKWGKEKMLSHKIKLPVDKNNEPDWQFMEDYIKSLSYSKAL